MNSGEKFTLKKHKQTYKYHMNTFSQNKRSVSQNVENRAHAYYPDMIMTQTYSTTQPEPQPFDATDISQFQQDFSYLQPNFSQKNEENSEKNTNNGENSPTNAQNNNSLSQNKPFLQADFYAQNNEDGQNFSSENKNSKNTQKSGINVEKIMNFMKNSSQKDLLSTMLASGICKNQNPVMVETLSKMLTQKKSEPKKVHARSVDDFEEM